MSREEKDAKMILPSNSCGASYTHAQAIIVCHREYHHLAILPVATHLVAWSAEGPGEELNIQD